MITNFPNEIFSGVYASGGHVQGIAVDTQRGFVYYSFTTMLLKTDMLGNALGSVKRLAGHLGCITYDAENDRVYGSLELKHDEIGRGIISKTNWDPSSEDAFYLVSFDCASIVQMDMDAENDGVMKAVYLYDVVKDYYENDEVSKKTHRYGCSGIDGTGLGYAFGDTERKSKKIMIAYGIYSDNERKDNDHQVILQYDLSVISQYGKELRQSAPHHEGPKSCEKRYFFYTGNTTYGVQNLEYDEETNNWFFAVYQGRKTEFKNFCMFVADGSFPPKETELVGRDGEKGLLLTSAALGEQGYSESIYGSTFRYGSTGMAAIGKNEFYFSHDGRNEQGYYTTLVKYRYSQKSKDIFEKI